MDQNVRDASFVGSDSRGNFKNVIAKRSDLAKFMGGRMVAPGSDTVYEAGLVVGQVTASGATKDFIKPYASGNSDGSQIPIGVLSESTLASADGSGTAISIITGGAVLKDLLVGLDSNAITVLGAKSYVEHGVNILEF